MALCGPKLSICGMLLSLWGVVQLVLLGIFFKVHAPALIEDIPIDEDEWAAQHFNPEYIYGLYDQNSYNCFIASAIYVAIFAFSFIQYRINLRSNYLTT